MTVEELLDSVRRIVSRWARTVTPLIEDAKPGDTTIKVLSTRRFSRGDEIVLRNPTKGEAFLFIEEVIDCETLRLTSPVQFLWQVSESSVAEKTFNQKFVQGIYLGEPDNIPRYPAITVKAVSKESEWLTIDSTSDKFNIQLTIYVQDSNQEDAYRMLLRLTDEIQQGLKRNIYPLVGPFNTVSVTEDIAVGDKFIKVSDTSDLWEPMRIYIEDPFSFQEISVKSIVDENTIELAAPTCAAFSTDYDPVVVALTRWIYNSWPRSVTYGEVFKGTMLKAATIDWFAEEEIVWPYSPGEPSLK